MGEVYRARDTKLKRDVAVKVLPEAFARDSERMARYQREAEVLASLNHPNIATVHGVEGNALVIGVGRGRGAERADALGRSLENRSASRRCARLRPREGIVHRELSSSLPAWPGVCESGGK